MNDKTADRILLVDDEPEIVEALKIFLDEEGYSSELVSSGVAALELLEKDAAFTVILLDIKMPGLDGVTVLKRIMASGSDAAIIMMSGHGSEDLAVQCMKDGAEDYISKPFVFDDLLQRIERARNHRRERLEKKALQQERDDFILMLSHDMKNPLTAVIGSIDIIREGCLGDVNEEQQDYLQSAIDSCNEVVTMIDNLLDIRKFEAGKIKMTLQPFDPRELLDKLANQFVRPARHEGIELTLTIEPDVRTITVDKNAFTRAIGNLLGNALKFTPEEGFIKLSCRRLAASDIQAQGIPPYVLTPPVFSHCSSYVRIEVSDSGVGMSAEELEFIFDRYTQFSRKVGKERGGAGLGLAYCKLAISTFNGVIWAESTAGQGSSFVILLPGTDN
jgi:signal transduction histidine kinase